MGNILRRRKLHTQNVLILLSLRDYRRRFSTFPLSSSDVLNDLQFSAFPSSWQCFVVGLWSVACVKQEYVDNLTFYYIQRLSFLICKYKIKMHNLMNNSHSQLLHNEMQNLTESGNYLQMLKRNYFPSPEKQLVKEKKKIHITILNKNCLNSTYSFLWME